MDSDNFDFLGLELNREYQRRIRTDKFVRVSGVVLVSLFLGFVTGWFMSQAVKFFF